MYEEENVRAHLWETSNNYNSPTYGGVGGGGRGGEHPPFTPP